MKGIWTFVLLTGALLAAGRAVESYLGARAQGVPDTAAVERAQARLGPAAGHPAKLVLDGLEMRDEVPGESEVYVSWLGTNYHERTCEALRHGRVAIPLSQALLRHHPCPRCRPALE